MIMRKPFLPVILSLFFVPALASQAWAQTPDELVEKHIAAMGGRDALSKLTSRRATGSITVVGPNGDFGGPVEMSYKAPNKVRLSMQLDLSAMGVPEKMIVEQKFNGAVGWSLNSLQGDNEITGSQLENMKNNVFPSTLLNYKATGITLELLPKEQVDGKDAFVIRATPKTGSKVKMYLDATTYLLVRTVSTVNSAQMGDYEQTSTLSDFRVVDGIKVPFQVVQANAQQSATIKLTKIEHNVALDDAIFIVKAPVAR